MKKLLLILISLILPLSVFSNTIKLKISPSHYIIKVDQKEIKPRKIDKKLKSIELSSGNHEFTIEAEGYQTKTFHLEIKKSFLLEEKLEKNYSSLSLIKEVQTRHQPKSVEFTPDGKYLASALLNDKGVDIFSVSTLQKVKQIEFPAKYAKQQGFVEIAFVKRLNEMWVSQMTTNTIHRIDLSTFTYKDSIPVKGIWPKVIHIDSNEKLAFVSNWESHDISVIDIDQLKFIHKIKTSGVPRGMATSIDGKYLYVCIYDNGDIQKINLKTMQVEKTLRYNTRGAKRHIVLDKAKNIFYISDMQKGSIFAINGKNDSLIEEVKVGKNINTIKLTQDGKYLFLSSRGPNNPQSYLLKGPEYGKIYVLDTKKMEVIDWIWGRNQPTGLDIAPGSNLMVFSDFLDNSIEFYQINYNRLPKN